MSNDPMREYSEVMRQMAAENKESEEADRQKREEEIRQRYDDHDPTAEEIESVTKRLAGNEYRKPGDDPTEATAQEIEDIIGKMNV